MWSFLRGGTSICKKKISNVKNVFGPFLRRGIFLTHRNILVDISYSCKTNCRATIIPYRMHGDTVVRTVTLVWLDSQLLCVWSALLCPLYRTRYGCSDVLANKGCCTLEPAIISPSSWIRQENFSWQSYGNSVGDLLDDIDTNDRRFDYSEQVDVKHSNGALGFIWEDIEGGDEDIRVAMYWFTIWPMCCMRNSLNMYWIIPIKTRCLLVWALINQSTTE